jgi:lipopolysaccharide transport system ATP-binding protein
MKEAAIQIRNLSKSYHIGFAYHRHSSLRDVIAETFRRLFRSRNRTQEYQEKGADPFWALKDVSVDITEGEVFGIIGRNGSGKTTLLKILSRISKPTTGAIDLYGSTSSLLEVGTGFHPELTGRENIYLSGLILGMKKAELEKKFDGIVTFSGVEKFIDMPVKHYSNGMLVRLGFSVAAHLDSDILLLDEVLAVGDAKFQHKCYEKLTDVIQEGRTVILVSHDLAAIERLCSRAMLLDEGRIVQIDEPKAVIGRYLRAGSKPTVRQEASLQSTTLQYVSVRKIRILDAEENVVEDIPFEMPASLVIDFTVHEKVPGLYLAVRLMDEAYRIILGTTSIEFPDIDAKIGSPGNHRARIAIPGHLLVPREYFVRVSFRSLEADVQILYESAASFRIIRLPHYIDPKESVHPVLEWELNTRQIEEVSTDISP